jgi:hypothetical protein
MLYLNCSCLNLALEFFLKIWNFSGIFRDFIDLSRYFWIYLCRGKYFEKKSILSNWAEPEGPTQIPSARRWPDRGPRGAHRGPAGAAAQRAAASQACVPCTPSQGARAPIKGQSRGLCATPPCHATRSSPPPPCPAPERRQTCAGQSCRRH